MTKTKAYYYYEDCDICAELDSCDLQSHVIKEEIVAHSVDCSETNRPHVGHWYRRTESSFSLGRPRTDVVASLTWRRSSTISRRERFGGAEAAFGTDVVRGRDLRALP